MPKTKTRDTKGQGSKAWLQKHNKQNGARLRTKMALTANTLDREITFGTALVFPRRDHSTGQKLQNFGPLKVVLQQSGNTQRKFRWSSKNKR